MNEIDSFEKHLGKGGEIEIDGEKYILKPLGTEYLSHFFKIMKGFSGASAKEGEEVSVEDMLKNLNDESLKSITLVIDATVDKSFPKVPLEQRREFGLKYMSLLIGKIMEINSADTGNIEQVKKNKVLERIEMMKKAKENASSAAE